MPRDERQPVTRLGFWKEAFWRPAGALVGVPYAVYGLFMFIRDEVIEPQNVEQWKLVHYISRLPWYFWVIATLSLAVAVTMEGSFRVLRKHEANFAKSTATLSERMAVLESRRPRLLLGYDLDYPHGYDPTVATFSWFSPFYIRNDGDDTAYNIRMETAGRVKGIEFSPQNNYPPDRQRHRLHLRRNGRGVSFSLYGEMIEDADFVKEIVARVTESGIESEELVLNVLLQYDSVTGLRFYDRFDLIYPCTRLPDGRVLLGTVVIRYVHPRADAPVAFSVRV